MASVGNLEFWLPVRKCPDYVFYNFFTTLIVLNTCLNYYLFLLYVVSDGSFVKCFVP